eukprot:TRINITY_DN1059_c0_g1_i1.p1 TRINITY_DN1059_c0_g1~~TRINITY_DN1059_c0_g1_i1.p1  ORF type:complete len:412 (-),score=73.87 TRINITY_DN1059_c0_g1_i1:2013-3248(-)
MSAFLALILQLIIMPISASIMEDWRTGRATYYGNEWWLWDIHQGSCGYSYLCPEEGTGWDITALPDLHPDYAGSCGQCYEVKCNPSNFQDNYGETLWREGVCLDPEASVVVTVTDTCPCYFPTNMYSNERWCCNDMEHFDLSIWAFEKLAEARWGVIGLSYRKVTCDHIPAKVAPEPSSPFPPTPVVEGTACPKGNFALKENWEMIQMMYRKRIENAGLFSYTNQPPFSFDEYYQTLSGANTPKTVSSQVFNDWLEDGWSVYTKHSNHYDAEAYGLKGSTALCSEIWPSGSLNINGPAGSMDSKSSFEMWVKVESGVPALDVNVGGPYGNCNPVALQKLFHSGSEDGYYKYDVFLGTFSSSGEDIEKRIVDGMGAFQGCGQVHSSTINTITLSNSQASPQTVCIDAIQIMQ